MSSSSVFEPPKQLLCPEAATKIFVEACDVLGFAGLIVEIDGHVVGMNRRAEALVGECIDLSRNLIAAKTEEATVRLHSLVQKTDIMNKGDRPLGPVVLPRASGRPVLAFVSKVHSIPTEPELVRLCTIVFLDPDEVREPPSQFLREAFSLTPSELRLASGLFRGESLKEIAHTRGTSIATLRVQLRYVFMKTKTTRQSELVALLARTSAFY